MKRGARAAPAPRLRPHSEAFAPRQPSLNCLTRDPRHAGTPLRTGPLRARRPPVRPGDRRGRERHLHPGLRFTGSRPSLGRQRAPEGWGCRWTLHHRPHLAGTAPMHDERPEPFKVVTVHGGSLPRACRGRPNPTQGRTSWRGSVGCQACPYPSRNLVWLVGNGSVSEEASSRLPRLPRCSESRMLPRAQQDTRPCGLLGPACSADPSPASAQHDPTGLPYPTSPTSPDVSLSWPPERVQLGAPRRPCERGGGRDCPGLKATF